MYQHLSLGDGGIRSVILCVKVEYSICKDITEILLLVIGDLLMGLILKHIVVLLDVVALRSARWL